MKTKHTILVTGGTGYIGSWVVKGLLEHGHTIRLIVRNKSQKEKYQFLADIAKKNEGSLEIWEADLLITGSFNEVAKGCDSIAHIASPFILKVQDAQRDLVDVRDVAKAHIFCLENKAEGRHILSGRVTDMLSFANIIREHYGNTYKLPKSNNPKWLISLIGGLFGLSQKFVKNNVGIPIQLDVNKSIEKLNLNYIPLEQTLRIW